MRNGVIDDDEFRGQLQRQDRLVAGGQFEGFEHDLLEHLLEILRQREAGAEVDLAEIFERRQLVWVLGGDSAHPRAHGESYLHHLVQRRLVIGGAERAEILVALHGLQRGVGLQYAAATGTEHVPRHVENADPCGMQECGDGAVVVQPVRGGEGHGVDAAELPVVGLRDETLHRVHGGSLGGLPEQGEHRLGFAHSLTLP
jgi:hypothetical protein